MPKNVAKIVHFVRASIKFGPLTFGFKSKHEEIVKDCAEVTEKKKFATQCTIAL